MAEPSAKQCTALNISDEKQCKHLATSINGLFCAFHSRQCQGLYKGYKRRNAALDRLDETQPLYLSQTKTPLSTNTFKDIDTSSQCREIHDWLFRKYQLLDRVIRARRLHHSRFFAMNYDYGHEKYLVNLAQQKTSVTRALERIERRTAEILFSEKKWFKWVRTVQDEEEKGREKEQKRVQKEAAMFKRHWKEVEARMRELRKKEDLKRQDAYLEEVYKQRMSEREEEDDTDDEEWDPIEDVLEDKRGSYIDLIKHFLWMAINPDAVPDDADKEANGDSSAKPSDTESAAQDKPRVDMALAQTTESKLNIAEPTGDAEGSDGEEGEGQAGGASSKKAKPSKNKKGKKKKKKSGAKAPSEDQVSTAVLEDAQDLQPFPTAPKKSKQPKQREPNKDLIETREEMYIRLKDGQDLELDGGGIMVGGTVENPEIDTKTKTFEHAEIEKLQGEITEIKHLLFCRILLGNATLLPAALAAESVDEFLQNPEVNETALRDLCLKMERPDLQAIRDACADLFRSDEEEDVASDDGKCTDDSDSDDDDIDDEVVLRRAREKGEMRTLFWKKKGDLPDKWMPRKKKEGATEAMEVIEESGMGVRTLVDFGELKDDGKFHKKLVRVKICGRYIWNYPSNRVLPRKGWLHFCIMAKDSSLYDAIHLCRSWDEFFELNILACYQYFPGKSWLKWVGSQFQMQMLQLGFIMYFATVKPDASHLTHHMQSGTRHGPGRRKHAMFEMRNCIAARIQRNSPASRRFIQYLTMKSHELLLLVRDAATGKILVKPPESQGWLLRVKHGIGRASRGEWEVLQEIGPLFFEAMEEERGWDFGFDEYFDIYVWDLEPGQPFPGLYNTIQSALFKAHRFTSPPEMYNLAAPVLKTLIRDERTGRCRDITPEDRENGMKSIWDHINSENARFFYGALEDITSHAAKKVGERNIPRHLLYMEADALEDEILFPEERLGGDSTKQIGKAMNQMAIFEKQGPNLMNFVDRYDSDYDDLSDSDDYTDRTDDEDDCSEDSETMAILGENETDSSAMIPARTPHDHPMVQIYQAMSPKAIKALVKEKSDILEATNESDESYPRVRDEFNVILSVLLARRDEIQEWEDSQPLTAKEKREKDQAMKREFMDFLDKEKSRYFKNAWHEADSEPGAQKRYAEMQQMVKAYLKYELRGYIEKPDEWLYEEFEKFAGDDEIGDQGKAIAKISPFFYDHFLASEQGAPFRDCLLFRQEERSKIIPQHRTATSNKFRAREFWDEYMKVRKERKYIDDWPVEWDTAIRPIIARLYASGIIKTRYDTFGNGQAVAAKEPGSSHYDFFVDYRHGPCQISEMPQYLNPYHIEHLLTTAQKFAARHPDACFSILRVWSSPYFYPLMVGCESRDGLSFHDQAGRVYEWQFVPKDMPGSEFSIHFGLQNRLKARNVESVLGRGEKFISLKSDKVLVMGRDRRECMKNTTIMAFALQCRPWRIEVDLWKSFVGVDLKFLEGLDKYWYD